MRKVNMSKFNAIGGGKKGNALAACTAALFDLPLYGVPRFEDHMTESDPDAWSAVFDEFVAERGYCSMVCSPKRPPQGFSIAVGMSGRFDGPHYVVYFDQEMLHDPHKDGSDLVEVWHFIAFHRIGEKKTVFSKETEF